MKNHLSSGKSLTLTAPAGGVTSGVPILIGALLLIPSSSADAGASFSGEICGEFSVDKTAGEAWAEGVTLYWDDTAASFTTTGSGNYKAGVASEVAASASTAGSIRLDGVSTSAEA